METKVRVIANDTVIASLDGKITHWVDQPSFRGTWDIVWTSLVTIFICTYTLLCLNVPAHNDTWWTNLKRRLLWMGLAIIAPEIVLTYAAGQWSRARQSVQAFHDSGFEAWTMRLAFFADMGGFVVQGKENKKDVRFPLNAKQLHWLVVHGHLEYPATNDDEIWDKSKQDRLSRAISVFQAAYLIVACIGRAAQSLAITTLELNALGIVVCALMTAFSWLHKPADVRMACVLDCKANFAEITGERQWKYTPLDFIDENGPGWAMNVQPFMHMPVVPPERPIQRIPNDRFPMSPYKYQEYCLCFATLLFTAIHVAGWNFSFPTTIEKVLWRISSLVLFGVTAVFWIFETMASWKRLERWTWLYLRIRCPARLPAFEAARDAKLDQPKEPTQLPLPWEFWSIMPVALLYGIARMYLIVEAFLEFRAVDGTAYENVNWSLYIPHI